MGVGFLITKVIKYIIKVILDLIEVYVFIKSLDIIYKDVQPTYLEILVYWLIESPTNHDAKSRPLFLWLNGESGCYLISDGVAEEIDIIIII